MSILEATKPSATPPPGLMTGRGTQLLRAAPPWTGIAILVVAMFIVMSIANDNFLSFVNLNNVLRGAAVPLLLGIGTTFVLTIGMIDLSLGALLALNSVIMLAVLDSGAPIFIAIPAVIVASTLLGGFANGFLIARFQLFFLVVTLGTMSIFRAVAQLWTGGTSVQLYDRPGFGVVAWLGDGQIGFVSVPFAISLVLLVLAILLMRYTTLGRNFMAIGGNPRAARLAGIPVERVQVAAFALNGLFVGIAGVLMTGRIQAASPALGMGLELEVIAAVLLGGSSFLGGNSTFIGTFIGVLFVSLLANMLNLLSVPLFWQGVVTGAVLIIAVAIDRLRRGRNAT